MKRHLITIAKYLISLAILAWLFWKAAQNAAFDQLVEQEKNWVLLNAALICCIAAVGSTFVRWYFLVRALDIPFTVGEALRLGFVGFLFNFLTLGVMGGDLVKSIFLARRRPGKRTEAVASVAIDRMIGLYALFVLGTIAILSFDLSSVGQSNPSEQQSLRVLCWMIVGATVAGTIGIGLVALPTFGQSRLWKKLCQLPKIGSTIDRVTTAILIYRARPLLMLFVGVMSLATHCIFVASLYLVARGLPGEIPSLGAHFIIVPLANTAGTLPLPGGLGAYEFALDFLYRGVATTDMAESQGFVIALGFRICTIITAMIGAAFYLSGGKEMSELIHEAEEEAEYTERSTD